MIEENVKQIYADSKRVFGIGGEHLVTLPEFKGVHSKYNDIAVIHFDAHTDLRKEYLGEEMSHSAVMYHIGKIIGFPDQFFGIIFRQALVSIIGFQREGNPFPKQRNDILMQKQGSCGIVIPVDAKEIRLFFCFLLISLTVKLCCFIHIKQSFDRKILVSRNTVAERNT